MGDNTQEQLRYATQVKERYEDILLGIPGVVGVGVGLRQRGGVATGEVAIVVLVEKKRRLSDLSPGERLPESLEGVPIDVMESGSIEAFGQERY